MPRISPEPRASSVSEFVTLFERGGALRPTDLQWYRGESRPRPQGALLPSIARRPSRMADEWSSYQRFRQSAAAFLPHASMSPWDWMLYMQHYGVRTRLLDWTESALAALYFAVERPARDRYDGIVWCLNPLRLNEIAGYGRILQCAGLDNELDEYTIESLKRGTATADYKPVALIAQRSFARLIAQQGVFTVIHRQRTPLDSIANEGLLSRVRIPAKSKQPIRNGLAALGVTRLTMFPEIQSVARSE